MTLPKILTLIILSTCAVADVNPVCETEHCVDDFAMIQVKVNSHARKTASPQCDAAFAAYAAYRYSTSAWKDEGSVVGKEHLESVGYSFVRGFNNTDKVAAEQDWDYVGWWNNNGDCIFNFQGSDANDDFTNNFNKELRTWHGVENIHSGVVEEISNLLDQVDWTNVKSMCTKITSVGHSLGGGMAQLFAAASNSGDLDVTVDEVYTFGAMAVGEENTENLNTQQSTDGCFVGKLVWNARRNTETGNTEVDCLRGTMTGGNEMEPLRSDKSILFGPDDTEEFECGNLIPYTEGSGGALHGMPMYLYNLGCISADEYSHLAH